MTALSAVRDRAELIGPRVGEAVLDVKSAVLLDITQTDAAVVRWGLKNQATGQRPELYLDGDDPDISGILRAKGTGSIDVLGGFSVTGATVLTGALTQSGGTVELDSPNATLYINETTHQVGIGTNAPATGTKLHLAVTGSAVLRLDGSTDTTLDLYAGSSERGYLAATTTAVTLAAVSSIPLNYTTSTGTQRWSSNGSSRGTLDSSGNWNLGTTSNTLYVNTAGYVGVGNTGTSGYALDITGKVKLEDAASKIIPGATSFSLRDTADAADNFKVLDSGAATIRNGLTLTSPGDLTFGRATSRIIPGATSLSLRNTANGADNLILTDLGLATFRNTVTISSGGAAITGNTSVSSGTFTQSGGTATFDTSTLVVDETSHVVGIGTASPSNTYKLDVNGKLRTADQIVIAAGGATISGVVTQSGGDVTLDSGSSTLIVDSTSHVVGIGVSPSNTYKLDVGGKLRTSQQIVVGGGGLDLTGTLQMRDAASKLQPGATSFTVTDTAGTSNNLVITDAGAATIRAGLTVTAGGVTVSGGGLTVSAGGGSISGGLSVAGGETISSGDLTLTAGKIVLNATASQVQPGATSLTFLNHTGLSNNLVITDAGAVTTRSTLTVGAGGVVVSGGGATLTGATSVSSGTFTQSGGAAQFGATPSVYIDETNDYLAVGHNSPAVPLHVKNSALAEGRFESTSESTVRLYVNGSTRALLDATTTAAGLTATLPFTVGTTGTNALTLQTNGGAALTIASDQGVQFNGTKVGFYGATPVTRSAAYTVNNRVADRIYDCSATTLLELANVVGTLILDLQSNGLLQ